MPAYKETGMVEKVVSKIIFMLCEKEWSLYFFKKL